MRFMDNICIRNVARSALALSLCLQVPSALGREHKKKEVFGAGFSNESSAPASEVLEAVQAVINDGVIEGSKEYNKDQNVGNAVPETSSSLFPGVQPPAQVFYKVRTKVLAPVNFKESNDEGTLAVRYIVQSKDASRTILRIDAVFVEDFRHTVHASSGSVEIAEYKSIQDRVDALEQQRKQTEEAEKHREEQVAQRALQNRKEQKESAGLAAAEASAQTLLQRVQVLRRQVERIVKAPAAQLKSAPFQTASNLKSLEAGAEVVVLVVTPYWYGVETEEGQHGWIKRSQLEIVQ